MENEKKLKSKMPKLQKSKLKLWNYISSKRKPNVETSISSHQGSLKQDNSHIEGALENSSISSHNQSIFSDHDNENPYEDPDSKTQKCHPKPGCSYFEDPETVIVNPSATLSSSSMEFSPRNNPISSPAPTIKSIVSEKTEDNFIAQEPIYATVDKNKNKHLNETLLKENEMLRQEIQGYIQKSRVKEDKLHIQLKNEMSEFEEETRREVTALKERLKTILKEKDAAQERSLQLQQEKEEALQAVTALDNKVKSMVPPEMHKKILSDYSKLLITEREQYKDVTAEFQHQFELLKGEKQRLLQELEDLKGQLTSSQEVIGSLTDQSQQLIHEKVDAVEQLNESKFVTIENQKVLLALLKVTENLAVERDILLNKVFFQDNQHKELQTVVVDYSLNLGRLQEHISIKSKESDKEFLKIQESEQRNQKECLQDTYGKQLDILREKILNQNNSIHELETAKRQLQTQLENMWDVSEIEYKRILSKVNL